RCPRPARPQSHPPTPAPAPPPRAAAFPRALRTPVLAWCGFLPPIGYHGDRRRLKTYPAELVLRPTPASVRAALAVSAATPPSLARPGHPRQRSRPRGFAAAAPAPRRN